MCTYLFFNITKKKIAIYPNIEHYSGMWKTLKHQAKHHNNWFEKTFARTYEGTSKS